MCFTPLHQNNYPTSVASLYVCQDAGIRGPYSMFLFAKKRSPPLETTDCHIIPANIMTPIILIRDPDELTIFQAAIESG